jgi:hypothetical protein
MKTLAVLFLLLSSLAFTKQDPALVEIAETPEQILRKADQLLHDEIAPRLGNGDGLPVLLLKSFEKDIRTVIDLSQNNPRLLALAKMRLVFPTVIFRCLSPSNTLNQELFEKEIEKFTVDLLKQWAPNSSATGKALREEVLQNAKNSPEIYNAIKEFALLENIDLALGNIPLDKFEILGIFPDEEDIDRLNVKIEYRIFPHQLESITLEL